MNDVRGETVLRYQTPNELVERRNDVAFKGIWCYAAELRTLQPYHCESGEEDVFLWRCGPDRTGTRGLPYPRSPVTGGDDGRDGDGRRTSMTTTKQQRSSGKAAEEQQNRRRNPVFPSSLSHPPGSRLPGSHLRLSYLGFLTTGDRFG